MGFMGEISEDVGWNQCIEYIISHLDEFQDQLSEGEYDYFPGTKLEEWLKNLKRKIL